ncbi:hypothetical protein CSOJ01_14256 [Colletotrichum sojae]|uniref:Uncharacterized protein n=1 Tax=Colletotrichum sojae TaxID=2175907 RepID=A0A8H6IQR6_9PEZI|nr:hypothetical protein CSOJ01_14256 [Colletotrichum sojae]
MTAAYSTRGRPGPVGCYPCTPDTSSQNQHTAESDWVQLVKKAYGQGERGRRSSNTGSLDYSDITRVVVVGAGVFQDSHTRLFVVFVV